MAAAERASADAAPAAGRGTGRIPGEAGVWVFVLGDMVVFGLFFGVLAWYRARDVAGFAAAQSTLNQHFGAVNTLLLLVSSWFVAVGVIEARDGARRRAPALFAVAFACGLAFVVLKCVEYAQKLAEGATLTAHDFYMFWWVYTGVHLLHVLIGLGVLGFLVWRARAPAPDDVVVFESGGIYWHLVDLLWIMLFTLLYLVQ